MLMVFTFPSSILPPCTVRATQIKPLLGVYRQDGPIKCKADAVAILAVAKMNMSLGRVQTFVVFMMANLAGKSSCQAQHCERPRHKQYLKAIFFLPGETGRLGISSQRKSGKR